MILYNRFAYHTMRISNSSLTVQHSSEHHTYCIEMSVAYPQPQFLNRILSHLTNQYNRLYMKNQWLGLLKTLDPYLFTPIWRKTPEFTP